MAFDDLSSNRSYSVWMISLKASSTKRVWTRCLREYCNWRGLSPDQLILKRQADLKLEDPFRQHDEEVQLSKFMLYLKYEGLSSNWQRVCWAAIQNFFKRNHLPLELFRGEGPRVQASRPGTRACTNLELKRMLDVAALRERALILFLAHTGLSPNEVARLTVDDLGKVGGVMPVNVLKLKPPVPLKVLNTKTGVESRTFISSEAWSVLRMYLLNRMRGTLKEHASPKSFYKRGVPPEDLQGTSPLFRSFGKWGKKRVPEVKHLLPNSIGAIVKEVARRADVYQEGFSAYALRRYFQKTLENAGILPSWIKVMMGQKGSGMERVVSQPSWRQLKEAYMKAESHLRTSFGQDEITSLYRSTELLKEELQDLKIKLKKETVLRSIAEIYPGAKDEDFERCMELETEEEIRKYLSSAKRRARYRSN